MWIIREKNFVCLNAENSFNTFTSTGQQQGMDKAATQT